jgi:lipopolysaccharide transport system permease protein
MALDRSTPAMRWSEAGTMGPWLDLGELWAYRELIFVFVLRELQIRYRQTLIGVAWVVIQPLGQVLVFSGFFHLLGSLPASPDLPYPVVLLSGSILWQVFSQGVQSATSCLSNNRPLITKTYFPRLALPLAAVLAPLVDFAIAWLCLVAVSLAFGMAPSVWWLATPLAGFLAAATALAVGVWTSMMNALYRDLAHALPFFLQMGFFFSPVLFQTETLLGRLSPHWQLAAAVNPLVTVIGIMRAGWLGTPAPTWPMAAVSLLVAAGVLASGLWFFRRMEIVVADRV